MTKTVFEVNVFRIAKNGIEFELVAKNVPLKEPVIYKESSIKEELLKQHPELTKKLKNHGWCQDIVKWF
jgi:hypothetical protein